MGKKKRPKLFTEEEMQLLIDNSQGEFRDLLILLRESGCRIREMLGLRAGDVYFRDGCAILVVNGKTGIRAVPVIRCMQTVRKLLEGRTGNERLFRYDYMTQYFRLKVLMGRLGIRNDISFHGFRHYAATYFIRNGMPEQILKKLMGWTPDSDMMNTYSHLCPEDVIDHVKRVNNGNRSHGAKFVWDVYN